ncbi:DUF503 domain-containing protein [Clostridium lundense]|uniref:DUF503 domain-containing protein n=1 Tax=Clostridium lundense TaxID=319475 RepID=UPI000483159B|nr:DUF503 domain-containing protein [Clostridium lundense]
MIIGTAKVYLRASWVHSLKEKRMIVQSITTKVRNKFNVSIAEIEDQDIHQSIVLGIAYVSNDTRHVNTVVQNVLNYIEGNTDAMVEDEIVEIL